MLSLVLELCKELVDYMKVVTVEGLVLNANGTYMERRILKFISFTSFKWNRYDLE